MFTLPKLPYALNALEPFISARTLEFHYQKHHQTYIDNLNKLIEKTKFTMMNLEEIITETVDKPEYSNIFNNAAQTWNHTFFWQSMQPGGGEIEGSELEDKIIKNFGSFEKFREEFKQAAVSQFGSGWAWLVEKQDGRLAVMKTANADTPIAHRLRPLTTCDVWEHAYYLDYQNRRAEFVDVFLNNLMKINF